MPVTPSEPISSLSLSLIHISMLEKLKELALRYEDLQAQLADPSVYGLSLIHILSGHRSR